MSVITTFTLTKAGGKDLFAQSPALTKRTLIRRFANELLALASGHGGGSGTVARTTIRYGTAGATGTVTCASVANADTLVINGTTLTATQKHARGTIAPTVSGIDVDDTLLINATTLTAKRHHSTGTVTIVIANTDVGDTVTINGVVFTAAAAEDTGDAEFDISGTATAAALSLIACIEASVDVLIAGIFTATNVAGVVTVRSVATGIATHTLVSSDADGLAVSGAGTTTAGTVPATGQFDISGSIAQCCTSILAAINANVTLMTLITASTTATVVTMRSLIAGSAGNYVLTSSDAQLAVSGAGTMTGGATIANNAFDFGGTDIETAADLVRCINASTTALVSGAVGAEAADAVITLTADLTGASGNDVTLSSTGGTMTCSVTRLAGGTETVLTF